MTDPMKLGRRGFLRLTAAVGGTAALGGGLARLRHTEPASVAFVDPLLFPDAPVEVAVSFPAAPRGSAAQLVLHVETPRGRISRDLGAVPLEGGAARVATTLVYPYETRVPGAYAYTLEATLGARRAVSEAAVGYGVRAVPWFS
jgi:hypothetical protein